MRSTGPFPSPSPTILSPEQWQAREAAHHERIDARVSPELDRRSLGEKDPVLDFLFEYYNFRPSHLRRWSPGVDVFLAGEAAEEFLQRKHFERTDDGIGLPRTSIPARRQETATWIHRLLTRTQHRRPMFGCCGMHEWAMVYEEADIRHRQVPLRVPHTELRTFVETHPIRCSHFDAFRFFSQSARGFNQLNPEANTRAELEQPGCLHANMDLYKWAYKLAPWIPSELIGDCFELAVRTREIDMRASPYDMRAHGFEPIAIETATGRAEYELAQRAIAEAAFPLRHRLLEAVGQLSCSAPPEDGTSRQARVPSP